MEHIAIKTSKTATFCLVNFTNENDLRESMAEIIFTLHGNGINHVIVDFLSEEEYQEELKHEEEKNNHFFKLNKKEYN